MENATKALLMAGGILMALLVIGALILMFNSLSEHQNQNDDSNQITQVVEFNNQFEPYNKDNLTLMDLKSIYNKIQSNNKNSNYIINHNIDQKLLDDVDANYDNKIDSDDEVWRYFSINNFNKIHQAQKSNRRFKCEKIEYKNDGGRISYMEFVDRTPAKDE